MYLSKISSIVGAEKQFSIMSIYWLRLKLLLDVLTWYLLIISSMLDASDLSNSFFKSSNFSEGTKWVAIPEWMMSIPNRKFFTY